MTNKGNWLKVLEARVEEWQDRLDDKEYMLKAEIKHFKDWVSKSNEEALIFNTQCEYNTLKTFYDEYKQACRELSRAKDELAAYKIATYGGDENEKI